MKQLIRSGYFFNKENVTGIDNHKFNGTVMKGYWTFADNFLSIHIQDRDFPVAAQPQIIWLVGIHGKGGDIVFSAVG